MPSLEETIADKIVSILTTDVTDLNTVNFGKVMLAIDDFKEHEVPAVQIFDLFQRIEHQRGYEQVSWTLQLEIIMKSLATGEVDQKSLWDLRNKVQIALWNVPNLEIPEVFHLKYTNNITDLHLVQPFYIARMEFDVLFRRPLTGSC